MATEPFNKVTDISDRYLNDNETGFDMARSFFKYNFMMRIASKHTGSHVFIPIPTLILDLHFVVVFSPFSVF